MGVNGWQPNEADPWFKIQQLEAEVRRLRKIEAAAKVCKAAFNEMERVWDSKWAHHPERGPQMQAAQITYQDAQAALFRAVEASE